MSRSRDDVVDLMMELSLALQEFPDLRLGQLIFNCLPERFQGDPFNISDDELLECLKEYRRQHGGE
jgi:hypothetical protein